MSSDSGLALGLIAATVLVLFIVRITGYLNLVDNERRVGAYVLDAVQNGNWWVQKDSSGEIASKPPLLTWCVALPTLLLGRITPGALYLPTAAATCAVAMILFAAGRKMFGWRAGFIAAFAYVFSHAGYSGLAVARYDGLLTLFVILAALAAFRSWVLGSGWTWFWLAAAVGTLAKGPIAVVLGAVGLLAALWERSSGSPVPFRGSHWTGVAIFLLIAGGWFALAYGQLGPPLLDKMIGKELIGHAVLHRTDSFLLGFFKPPLDFVERFAPWSLAALCSFWRVWKQPASDAMTRRFERFLVCGFFAGLLIFCLAGHHRGRLIQPLIPLAALLAGRELAGVTRSWSIRRFYRVAILMIALYVFAVFIHAHFLLRYSSHVQKTIAARQMARLITQNLGPSAPLTYVDSPFALQLYLNIVRPQVPFDRAAALLKGDAAAWVVVCNFSNLVKELGPDVRRLHEVARWPAADPPLIRVVGNQPLPITNQPVAMLLGPIRIETHSLFLEQPRIMYPRGMELNFRGNAKQGKLWIENQGDSPQAIRVRIFDASCATAPMETECHLLPGTTWEFPGICPVAEP